VEITAGCVKSANRNQVYEGEPAWWSL